MTNKTADDIMSKGTLTAGIFRWNSNNEVPFKDVIEVLFKAGKISEEDVAKNTCCREEENARFIQDFVASQKQRTAEQKAEEAYEMRAAFGAGEKVVNVFTGEVTYT